MNRFILPGCPSTYGTHASPWQGDDPALTQLLWLNADGTAPACPQSPPPSDAEAQPDLQAVFPCLLLRPPQSTAAPLPVGSRVFLFLHGNGEDLGSSYHATCGLRTTLGATVVIPEYPGYGPLQGRASPEAINARARAGFNFVANVLGVPDDHIVVLGRSIGTGPATTLVARLQAEGRRVSMLALVSPFSSMRDLVSDKVGRVAASMVEERWPTQQLLTTVGTPMLIVHGVKDTVIQPKHSQALAGAVRAHRREEGSEASRPFLMLIDGVGHNDINWQQHVAPQLHGLLRGIDACKRTRPECWTGTVPDVLTLHVKGFPTSPEGVPRGPSQKATSVAGIFLRILNPSNLVQLSVSASRSSVALSSSGRPAQTAAAAEDSDQHNPPSEAKEGQ
eukprot:TRINITY_DN43925_c0_g1_i1.p1 TRINITY_DN43925_c0_g1~~TRINITY_DN43925_c0_g1_i1.p1  ORF type:complete len:392 (+),score=36.71 TRINITY_DN43925_c0_g1_i1:92-1267(+)